MICATSLVQVGFSCIQRCTEVGNDAVLPFQVRAKLARASVLLHGGEEALPERRNVLLPRLMKMSIQCHIGQPRHLPSACLRLLKS